VITPGSRIQPKVPNQLTEEFVAAIWDIKPRNDAAQASPQTPPTTNSGRADSLTLPTVDSGTLKAAAFSAMADSPSERECGGECDLNKIAAERHGISAGTWHSFKVTLFFRLTLGS
jgi:hypothetical protein